MSEQQQEKGTQEANGSTKHSSPQRLMSGVVWRNAFNYRLEKSDNVMSAIQDAEQAADAYENRFGQQALYPTKNEPAKTVDRQEEAKLDADANGLEVQMMTQVGASSEKTEFVATLRAIQAAGRGRTRIEAIERLCLVLGDLVEEFVRKHVAEEHKKHQESR